MAFLSEVVYSDGAAVAGLMLFGVPALVFSGRLAGLMVARLEFNKAGIIQQGLLRRTEIPWSEVAQILVDQDGQCRVEAKKTVIVIRAGVYTDLRALAWWVEFMAGKQIVRVPRFGGLWLFRYSRLLLPVATGLMVAAVIWLDSTPAVIGGISGLLMGRVWATQVGEEPPIKKRGGPIFVSTLLPSIMLFGLVLNRIGPFFAPLLILGGVWGMLFYAALARDGLVQLLRNQGLHI
jgi:hypothetical protein